MADRTLGEEIEEFVEPALAAPVKKMSKSAMGMACFIEQPKMDRDTSFPEPITGAAKYLGNGYL